MGAWQVILGTGAHEGGLSDAIRHVLSLDSEHVCADRDREGDR